MKTIDPKPYDQSTRDTAVKLFMELMAFSAAADYSRVAVLKIGDRIDDHVYTYNGQSAKFHDVSHRQVANAIPFHNYIDRMMLNYYKYLLDTVSAYNTPTGSLLDQGVAIYCNQVRDRRALVQQHPLDPGGNGQRLLQEGAAHRRRQRPAAGRQPGRQGAATPRSSGVNKMLNTVLTAAGVTKTGGAPTDNFGDASLPKGIFTELLA